MLSMYQSVYLCEQQSDKSNSSSHIRMYIDATYMYIQTYMYCNHVLYMYRYMGVLFSIHLHVSTKESTYIHINSLARQTNVAQMYG